MISWNNSFKKINKMLSFSYIFLIIGLYVIYKYNSKKLFGSPKQIIYFHMETCTYCKRFNPIWDEFYSRYNGDLKLTKIEANDAGDDMLSSYNVKGFPTIILKDVNGNIKHYNGNRTLRDLEDFVNS